MNRCTWIWGEIKIPCTRVHGFENKTKYHVPGYMDLKNKQNSMYRSTWIWKKNLMCSSGGEGGPVQKKIIFCAGPPPPPELHIRIFSFSDSCTPVHWIMFYLQIHVPRVHDILFFLQLHVPGYMEFWFFFKSMYPGTWNSDFFHYSYV